MNLYLISQTVNQGYDTYDCAVVAAETESDARSIHPNRSLEWDDDDDYLNNWVPKESRDTYVSVEYLGEAMPGTKPGVICASYNAG